MNNYEILLYLDYEARWLDPERPLLSVPHPWPDNDEEDD